MKVTKQDAVKSSNLKDKKCCLAINCKLINCEVFFYEFDPFSKTFPQDLNQLFHTKEFQQYC